MSDTTEQSIAPTDPLTEVVVKTCLDCAHRERLIKDDCSGCELWCQPQGAVGDMGNTPEFFQGTVCKEFEFEGDRK